MPKRRKEKRETGYVIILFLFIVGIGLFINGHLEGILPILLGLLITIAMFPAVGKTISENVKDLMSLIGKRKTKRSRKEKRFARMHAICELLILIGIVYLERKCQHKEYQKKP